MAVETKATLTESTLTVTLAIPAGCDLATFETTLQYDTEKLTYSGATFETGDMTTANTETEGQVKLFMIWAASQNEAVTLANVTFTVNEGAKGKTTVQFSNAAATDSADAAIEVAFADNAALEVALTDAPDPNEKIPSTAGTYVAVGSAVAAAVALAVVAGAAVKRKRNA